MTTSEKKKALREVFLNQRRKLSVEEWESLSIRISTALISLLNHLFESERGEARRSLQIHCYLSVKHNREVRTDGLISQLLEAGHQVGIPKTDPATKTMKTIRYRASDPIEEVHFGLREPVDGPEIPAEKLDLVILPHVALDTRGGRLGYGMGFYDRYLENTRHIQSSSEKRPVLVSPAFECSLSSEPLPAESTDIPVDWIVTETRILQATTGRSLS